MEYREYPTSSNVERIAFYPSIGALAGADDVLLDVLTIRFKNGQTYAYWNVSPPQWEQLRDHAGSIGALVQSTIVAPTRKGEYEMRKLDAEWLGTNNVDAAVQEAERAAADGGTLAHAVDDPAASIQTHPDAVLKAPARRRLHPRR